MIESIGKVVFSSPSSIWIEISDPGIFERNKRHLQVGKFLSIADGNYNKVICSIQNIKAKELLNSQTMDSGFNGKFIIESQPIGTIIESKFSRGSNSLPIPLEDVFLAEEDVLNLIFTETEDLNYHFGNLLQNNDVNLYIDGNKFFGKHIAVVGSTGSGKSCTVAQILHNAVGIKESVNINLDNQKNSHIIIFDIHSEYQKAFELCETQKFGLNYLDVSKLKLPYWLMNSEELEDLFIESKESNSYNQVSMFKQAIIANKEKYNPKIKKIDYDTPVYFSINEVYKYIYNQDTATKDANTGDLQIVSKVDGIEDKYQLFENITFKAKVTGKINAGPFAGEFTRFLSRLNTLLNDKRLKFLTEPKKVAGDEYKTSDFTEILKQFIGYSDKSNVTIIDLSGVPFEVLSITVSLISRIIFDFCFHYSKLLSEYNKTNDNPIMIVFEEAHNYIPRSSEASFKSAKKSVERIAKEGRKYGLSLMVVSQRPSEVSETIFSQCNNFVALRLTNPNDQNFIKNLLPDSISSLSDILPSLGKGQCLIVGDSVPIPTLVQLSLPEPRPSSDDIAVLNEWKTEWKNINFEDVIKKWKKED